VEVRKGLPDHLIINLFGEFKYQIAGTGAQSLKSRKSEAVLLALALSGNDGLSRQALVALLWPDLKQDRARAGLRQALSRIRGLAPHIFVSPRSGWIALSPNNVACDFWKLDSAIKGQMIEGAHLPVASLLTLFPSPTSEFEDWVVTKKRFLIERLRADLDRMVKNESSEISTRELACKALSTLTKTDERCISTLLDFYYETNNLKQYEVRRRQYIDQLEKELGLKPSVKFLEKYTQITGAENKSSEPSRQETAFHSPILAIVEEFRLIGAQEHQSFLAKALPEEIISHLIRQEWIDVKAISPSEPDNTREKGQSYRHAFSVYGSIKFEQNHITVTVRLTNQATGKIIWSQSIEEPLSDNQSELPNIIDIISESLLTKMVDSTAEFAATIPDGSPSGDWVNTMKARRLFWQTSRENNQKAKTLLQPIIEKNTAPISALVTATFTRLLTVWSAWEDQWDDEMRDARLVAQKAVRLYPSDPWSHFALATCFCAMRKHDDSMRTIEHALTLHDSFSTGIGLRGHIKVFCGLADEGREDLLKALTLNPVDPHLGIWQNSISIASFLKGENETALEWVVKAQSSNSYWLQNYVVLVCVHSALGNQKEAKSSFKSLMKLAPNFSRENWLYSHPFGNRSTENAFLIHLRKYGF